jgi:hypothetical protein
MNGIFGYLPHLCTECSGRHRTRDISICICIYIHLFISFILPAFSWVHIILVSILMFGAELEVSHAFSLFFRGI